MKYFVLKALAYYVGRAPYGARGLKLLVVVLTVVVVDVAPHTGRVD